MSRKSEAEALRIAYGAGIVPRSDVIEWAYAAIDEDEGPDPAILEIVTASRVDDSVFHEVLGAVSGTPDPAQVGSLVLRKLAEGRSRGTVSVANAAHGLYALAQHDWCAFSEGDRASMLRFDDEFELAAGGIYGDVSVVSAEIDAFLSRHGRL
jgi:hypothetical protein